VNNKGEIIGIVKASDSYNESMYIIPIDVISQKEGFAKIQGTFCFQYVDRNRSKLIKEDGQVMIKDFYFRDGDIKLERGEDVNFTDVDEVTYFMTGTKSGGMSVGVSLSPVVTFTGYVFQNRDGKVYCLHRAIGVINALSMKTEKAHLVMEFKQFIEEVKKKKFTVEEKKEVTEAETIKLAWSDGYTETIPVIEYKSYYF
jgi:virulence-associated protein VapD